MVSEWVSRNDGTPSSLDGLFFRENRFKMDDDWGYPYGLIHSQSRLIVHCHILIYVDHDHTINKWMLIIIDSC